MTHQTVTSKSQLPGRSSSSRPTARPEATRHGSSAPTRPCASGRTPFLTGARELLKRGYDPSTIIVMRHAGSSTDGFRARLEAAAKLSVKEENGRPPRFVLWNERDLGQGSARTATDEPAATYPASQPELPL